MREDNIKKILTAFTVFCLYVPMASADPALIPDSIPIERQKSFFGTVAHPTIDGGVINRAQDENGQFPRDQVTPEHPPFMVKPDPWVDPQHIKQMLHHAQRDRKWQTVLAEIHAQDLPIHLALIPMVESGYQSDAVSQKGAAGLWQLMESTAKDYGLTAQERFSTKKSTTAALAHLKNLHQEFHDWNLAFAAYNAGSFRIKQALHQNPSATSIDELHLPKETQQYVSRLNQLAQLLKKDLL